MITTTTSLSVLCIASLQVATNHQNNRLSRRIVRVPSQSKRRLLILAVATIVYARLQAVGNQMLPVHAVVVIPFDTVTGHARKSAWSLHMIICVDAPHHVVQTIDVNAIYSK